MINVTWHDAQNYVRWLRQATDQYYRLPSEAEWEYACRAGTAMRYSVGDTITDEDANFGLMKVGKTTEVGAYLPNRWGLSDMHGNVWEWVEDVSHGDYQGAPADGSAWEEKQAGALRVFRGGSWYDIARYVRSAYRRHGAPDARGDDLGFRCARVLKP